MGDILTHRWEVCSPTDVRYTHSQRWTPLVLLTIPSYRTDSVAPPHVISLPANKLLTVRRLSSPPRQRQIEKPWFELHKIAARSQRTLKTFENSTTPSSSRPEIFALGSAHCPRLASTFHTDPRRGRGYAGSPPATPADWPRGGASPRVVYAARKLVGFLKAAVGAQLDPRLAAINRSRGRQLCET
ncbi:hypothetical protein RRG08_045701 [Elysia crispata]|uniref:Uncharacterized protein n=1 Tax=Elysia crispata TaxID=231223 RepID=A0AAE1D8K7_9GAST|nr:hypothetical protein RRG08_045701 [Elysia crispata]